MAETSDPTSEHLYRAVTVERLFDAVVKQIEALITAERLAAGDAIPSERRLSELLGVSRSVVREAMRALERSGLIEIKPGRGAFVANPTADSVVRPLSLLIRMRRGTVHDCLEFRRYLEPQIAHLAAQRRSDRDVEMMGAAVNGMDAWMHAPERFIEYDLAFHSALAQATGNPVFLLVLDSTIGLMQEIRAQTMHLSGAFDRDRSEHRSIFERVRHADPAGAEAAMIVHLDSIARQLSQVEAAARDGRSGSA